MKTACVACVQALLPTLAAADYVATEEEEAAMRTRIAKNPPTAETLSAQPYPGAKLDVVCSASRSAERQPQTMVYCFYTRDPIDKVQAHLDGPGKPDPAVYVRADRGDVVDAQSRVTISDITKIVYYVNTERVAGVLTAVSRPGDCCRLFLVVREVFPGAAVADGRMIRSPVAARAMRPPASSQHRSQTPRPFPLALSH